MADSTTFSGRGEDLAILPQRIGRHEPVHLLIDSTGLKIYGEGEWLDQKYGIRERRRWRKPRIAVDAASQEIVAVGRGGAGMMRFHYRCRIDNQPRRRSLERLLHQTAGAYHAPNGSPSSFASKAFSVAAAVYTPNAATGATHSIAPALVRWWRDYGQPAMMVVSRCSIGRYGKSVGPAQDRSAEPVSPLEDALQVIASEDIFWAIP